MTPQWQHKRARERLVPSFTTDIPPPRTLYIFLLILAGTPTTTVLSGTSFVTTLPAPTIAFSPMVTPHRIVVLVPMEAPFFTRVGTTFQSPSVCRRPSPAVERGYLSLINDTLCPTNTSSSIVTPSQMKVWL